MQPNASTTEVSRKIALVLLAAGESRRMGQPKQLLPIHGRPLIVHMVTAARGCPVDPVVVVTGAHAEAVHAVLAPHPVAVVHNPDWPAGPGSSLRAGLQWLVGHAPQCQAALIVLGDQPNFDAAAAHTLLRAWESSGRPAAATRWGERLGPPAVFARAVWADLLASGSAHGARRYLTAHPERVAACDLPHLTVDLDTPADYAAWVARARRPPETPQ